MDYFSITFALTAFSVFLLTVIAERILIPILKSNKAGQRILEIGPRWHKSKEGTPIMGGIGFILPILLVMAGYFTYRAVSGKIYDLIPLSLTLGFAVANGAVGFIDDYCKLIKKQNEGLTWKQKLFLQLLISGGYVASLACIGHLSTSVALPFLSTSWELGWFYYPLAILLLCGVVNGGNLTDGIDGLASSVTFVTGGFFAVLAFTLRNESLSALSAALIGATLGFLVYNFHPARVFMGDTGSLFLGAMVVGGAFQIQNPLLSLFLAGVFILEMLSSLLQVLYFKLTHGKRLFKMAPIHHHFEKCGWSENKIVFVFSLTELAFCILAWFART